MTSGVGLGTSTVGPQNPGGVTSHTNHDVELYWQSSDKGNGSNKSRHVVSGVATKKVFAKKRQNIAISTPAFKKLRTSVQRTHSPDPRSSKNSSSTAKSSSYVETVTPTVSGIKDVTHHLLNSRSSFDGNKKLFSMVALPTECTYEICSLVSWKKGESLSEAESSFRDHQLEKLEHASSSSSVHVYLQHHNIKLMDKLLNFPKKAFATRQNPEVCCAFNETRMIFQRLADQFWPGPVLLYLAPESFVPNGLMRRCFGRNYIGFRCPSHPLTVKVLKQIHEEADGDTAILIGSPIQEHLHQSGNNENSNDSKLLTARDVMHKYSKKQQQQELTPSDHLGLDDSAIQVLHGEERKEIFTVPSCQFRDEWLEVWIVPKKRTIVLRGKSQRDVLPQLRQVLRSPKTKNRIIQSVLQHWKVADQRKELS